MGLTESEFISLPGTSYDVQGVLDQGALKIVQLAENVAECMLDFEPDVQAYAALEAGSAAFEALASVEVAHVEYVAPFLCDVRFQAAAAEKGQQEAAAAQKKVQEEAAAAKKKQDEAAAAQSLDQRKVRFVPPEPPRRRLSAACCSRMLAGRCCSQHQGQTGHH